MDFIDRSLVIVDLETTGLDPLVHEVIDIGAVRVDQASLDIEATFSAKLRPCHIEQQPDPKALEVNGYSPEAWKNAVDQFDGWRSFFFFARQGVFCSYRNDFDWSFTEEALRLYWPKTGDRDKDRFGPFDRHLIDIPSIAWGVLGPLPKIGKNPVAIHLGIGEEKKPHGGLNGALHALEVLRSLRARRNFYAQAA